MMFPIRCCVNLIDHCFEDSEDLKKGDTIPYEKARFEKF